MHWVSKVLLNWKGIPPGFNKQNPPAPYNAMNALALCGFTLRNVIIHDEGEWSGPKYEFKGTIEHCVGSDDVIGAIGITYKHCVFTVLSPDGTKFNEVKPSEKEFQGALDTLQSAGFFFTSLLHEASKLEFKGELPSTAYPYSTLLWQHCKPYG